MSSRISVVIPTRDRAALLDRTLDSVVGQTALLAQSLVVDAGSSDGTEALVRKRCGWIYQHCLPRYSGALRGEAAA